MTPRLSQAAIDGPFAGAAPLLEYNGPFTLHRVVLQTSRTPVDRLFRAFSDRTRLRILHLLQQGELCVCDLVSILRVPQPTASRHLAYLRRAGLVRVRQEQSWKYLLDRGAAQHLSCEAARVPQILLHRRAGAWSRPGSPAKSQGRQVLRLRSFFLTFDIRISEYHVASRRGLFQERGSREGFPRSRWHAPSPIRLPASGPSTHRGSLRLSVSVRSLGHGCSSG